MKRAVIYSRFSTDLQNEKSIEHQEAVARGYAERMGLSIVETYSDAAKSGASILGRDGLLMLLADAKRGQFDVVIVEALDRLSRDMEDLAGIHKRLTFAGVEIAAIHEGVASTVTIGLRGLVGQLFREDGVLKTKRGMRGKVDAGMLAGGVSYGYRMDPYNKGVPIIVDDQAEVVRRIFRDYVAGKSPKQIATELTAEGVAPPRGRGWQCSAIYGWEKRGTGILRNPLYAGRIVWNRSRFIKDPETGSRVSRQNDKSEWVTKDAPEYRIIDQALWDAAQARCAGRVVTPVEAGSMRRPKRMLSGLLKCGGCGGGMSAVGQDKSGKTRIACTRHQAGAHCDNPKTFYLNIVEELVVDTLRKELETPAMLAEYVTAYNEARVEFARQTARRRNTLEKKIHDLDAECDRLLQLLIKNVGNEDRIGADMKAKDEQLKALRVELEQEPAPVDVVALHPGTVQRYQAQLEALHAEISDDIQKNAPEIGALMRELIHSITLYPTEKWGGVSLEIQGKLRLLLEGNQPRQKSGGTLVAGAGFEPTTFRL